MIANSVEDTYHYVGDDPRYNDHILVQLEQLARGPFRYRVVSRTRDLMSPSKVWYYATWTGFLSSWRRWKRNE